MYLQILITCGCALVVWAEQEKMPITQITYEPPYAMKTRASNEKWGTYIAKVNNFNSQDVRTFKMRYLSNTQFERQDSPPIIIYVGGEWTIKEGQLGSGQLFAMAQENEGALFYTEHRFYGKSMPKEDYTTKSLKYLTSKQAMADLAGFIAFLKTQPKYTNSKVALFGCSYSATLSTWMKLTYPELITAIYVTSGPLEPKDDMFEYLERATLVMNALDPDCSPKIKEAIDGLSNLYDTENGASEVREMLGICDPTTPEEPYDKMTLFQNIAVFFGNLIQSNPSGYRAECDKFNAAEGDSEMEKFANYRRQNRTNCLLGDYQYVTDAFSNTTVEGGAIRAFFYQQCTGLGWFVTTDSENQPFGNDVLPEYYHQLCRDAFTSKLTDDHIINSIDETKNTYGGRDPDISQAVFVYGGLDPWQPMGLQFNFTNNDEAIVYFVPSAGHCYDMFSETAKDDEDMLTAKRGARYYIKKWLSD